MFLSPRITHYKEIIGSGILAGKRAVSGSGDNTIKIWDLAAGKSIATFTGEAPFTSCALAPDCHTIVTGDDSGRVHFLRLVGA
jgi:WD40 repeat protein